MATFPRPTQNTLTEASAKDPMMVRTHQDKLDIGARSSGLPKIEKSDGTISHVGGNSSKRG